MKKKLPETIDDMLLKIVEDFLRHHDKKLCYYTQYKEEIEKLEKENYDMKYHFMYLECLRKNLPIK